MESNGILSFSEILQKIVTLMVTAFSLLYLPSWYTPSLVRSKVDKTAARSSGILRAQSGAIHCSDILVMYIIGYAQNGYIK